MLLCAVVWPHEARKIELLKLGSFPGRKTPAVFTAARSRSHAPGHRDLSPVLGIRLYPALRALASSPGPVPSVFPVLIPEEC